MADTLLALACSATPLVALAHLLHSRERRYRHHEAARQARRAAREQQWRAMIRGDDEMTPCP